MTDTLSTHSSATSDKLVPTDTDKDPIKWDNNRATIEGKLHEVALYYTRTDQFIDLVVGREPRDTTTVWQAGWHLTPIKPLSSSMHNIQWVNGATIDRRSFLNPCPPTDDRIRQVNLRRAAMVCG